MTKIKSFKEFSEEYSRTGLIDRVYHKIRSVKEQNCKQLKRHYERYLVLWNKLAEKSNNQFIDSQSKDSCLSAFVRNRDNGCRLLSVLTENELNEWGANHNGIGLILDAAHVFGKNAYPKLRYNKNNIVTLNRFSHSLLDTGRNPLNGCVITAEDKENWWRRIVNNDEVWEALKASLN